MCRKFALSYTFPIISCIFSSSVRRFSKVDYKGWNLRGDVDKYTKFSFGLLFTLRFQHVQVITQIRAKNSKIAMKRPKIITATWYEIIDSANLIKCHNVMIIIILWPFTWKGTVARIQMGVCFWQGPTYFLQN